MQDKVTARKIVLFTIALMIFLAVYRGKTGKGDASTFQRVYAAGVVGLFLSFLADFVPQIAGPFAALVALGSITNGGDQVIQGVVGKATSVYSGGLHTRPQGSTTQERHYGGF